MKASDSTQILDRWTSHFRQLLNHSNPTDPSFLSEVPQLSVSHELDSVPTIEEVIKSIAALKNHKAAGPDNIPAELLKYGGIEITTQLQQLFQCCWESGCVPQQFKDGKIVTIYKKKGAKSLCSNSRDITILSTAGKTLARIMLMRLLSHIAERILPESQCGFRRETSTTDMVYVARLLQRVASKPVFYASNDATGPGITFNYRLDGNLFNNARMRAKTRTSTILVVELQYADDAAFVSHTQQGLKSTLDAIVDSYTRVGLVVNTNKIEVLYQRTGHNAPVDDPNIEIDGNALKVVPHCTYLASVLSSDCTINDEITRRIALASTAFGRLSYRGFYNHNLTLSTKRYHIKKLERFHIHYLQRILGIHWWDKIPHTAIRQRMNIPCLEEILIQRQLRWTGHIIRQPTNRLLRIVIYGELYNGQRTVGRPKKRIKDHTKDSLKKFNINPAALEREASDRKQWRSTLQRGAYYFRDDYEKKAEACRARRHTQQRPHLGQHSKHEAGGDQTGLDAPRSDLETSLIPKHLESEYVITHNAI
ncbi:uncharacterized protein LOC143018328 [Oratosquilla oratoria]|uniref:uncharacterized protein LOC143018328 n=1 Tax=Oratosquilla oratoria TaxID=337810 RepID=UPI003F7773DE